MPNNWEDGSEDIEWLSRHANEVLPDRSLSMENTHTPRVYGQWAGNPKGQAEDVTHCIKEVWEPGRGFRSYQCQRKRGFGPDGLYCKQHDPEAVKKRQKASDRRYKEGLARRQQPFEELGKLRAESAENKRKLEAFDAMLEALRWCMENLPDGVAWGGPSNEDSPQGWYYCTHCDARWKPQADSKEFHAEDCELPKVRALLDKLAEGK